MKTDTKTSSFIMGNLTPQKPDSMEIMLREPLSDCNSAWVALGAYVECFHSTPDEVLTYTIYIKRRNSMVREMPLER